MADLLYEEIEVSPIDSYFQQPQKAMNNAKPVDTYQVDLSKSREKQLALISQDNQKGVIDKNSDLSNHNLIQNKKSKVNKVLQLLREMKSKPRYKDKYGNNVKQHFGIYKYFINTQTQEKEKFYISNECRKIPANIAMKVQQKEQENINYNRNHYYEKIQRIGKVVKDKVRLEYWGLPPGICDQFYKHTKIGKLFDWQAECLSKSPEVIKGMKNLIYFAPTSDEGRGYQLESLIAKLRSVEVIMQKPSSFQIIGMSATLSGLEYLNKWFGGNCEIYECQFRPVPLSEYLFIGNKIYNKDMNMDNSNMNIKGQPSMDNDFVIYQYFNIDQLPLLLASYMRKRKAALIFCPSKNMCETYAKKLAFILPAQYPEYESQRNLNYDDIENEIKSIIAYLQSQKKRNLVFYDKQQIYDRDLQAKRLRILTELQQCPSGVCSILKETIKTGALFLLVATSTLSTGINLPAKVVIFKGPYIARTPIDAAKYKQMSGRAGRTGFDSKGDSIMICNNSEKDYVIDLMKPFKCELKSALTGQRLMRSILEIIASNVVQSFVQIRIFVESTLKNTLCKKVWCNGCIDQFQMNEILFGARDTDDFEEKHRIYNQYDLYLQNFCLQRFKTEIQDDDCRNCLLEFAKQVVAYLNKFKFLTYNNEDGSVLPTLLGKAAFASSIPPEHGQKIFEDLAEARGSLVLETDLHLLYLITPHFKHIREPNWDAFIKRFNKLTKGEKNVAEFYGIDIQYLYKATVYPPKIPSCLQDQSQSIGASNSLSKMPSSTVQDSKSSKGIKQTTLTQSSSNTSGIISMVDSMNDSALHIPLLSQMEQLIQIQSLSDEEQKLIRYYEICKTFNIKRGDIQTLQALAVNYSGMLSAFCERLFWSDYSVLLLRINEKINWCVKEELLDLMQCPSLRPERARALYNAGYTLVEEVAKEASVDGMVKIFDKNDGFMSHRKSNTDDLKLKYDYYYTLAHKVLCEAKMIMVKRKVDPDRTMISYMQQGQGMNLDQKYVIDSDYSSDEGEKLDEMQKLSGDQLINHNLLKDLEQSFHTLNSSELDLIDLDSDDLSDFGSEDLNSKDKIGIIGDQLVQVVVVKNEDDLIDDDLELIIQNDFNNVVEDEQHQNCAIEVKNQNKDQNFQIIKKEVNNQQKQVRDSLTAILEMELSSTSDFDEDVLDQMLNNNESQVPQIQLNNHDKNSEIKNQLKQNKFTTKQEEIRQSDESDSPDYQQLFEQLSD
ncbi:dna polymerase theta [Stylonychia lemnae]|uniref:Dna polymerase theta n=1 Tax=Stylonychia lemnae TaxID=5949 RepID=A0A078AGQ3_STYLE|nr:dna polymerase theta [Stylonychia lemnae]|eukprot:CDW81021.1 dna polymerase theta [Stylonychia lemnae]